MPKTLLFSILLVLVYQFDELVNGLLLLVKRIFRHKYKYIIRDTDHYVGTALTIATMPMLLYSVMLSDNSLIVKMVWLSGIYLSFAILCAGIGYFLRQITKASRQHGSTLILSGMAVVGGLFHPSMNFVPWNAGRERMVYAKLAFLLSVPAILGVAFKTYYTNYQVELDQYLDVLIIVMIGGVFINITISILEKYLIRHDVGMLGYFRIVAGLAIAFILLK